MELLFIMTQREKNTKIINVKLIQSNRILTIE